MPVRKETDSNSMAQPETSTGEKLHNQKPLQERSYILWRLLRVVELIWSLNKTNQRKLIIRGQQLIHYIWEKGAPLIMGSQVKKKVPVSLVSTISKSESVNKISVLADQMTEGIQIKEGGYSTRDRKMTQKAAESKNQSKKKKPING